MQNFRLYQYCYHYNIGDHCCGRICIKKLMAQIAVVDQIRALFLSDRHLHAFFLPPLYWPTRSPFWNVCHVPLGRSHPQPYLLDCSMPLLTPVTVQIHKHRRSRIRLLPFQKRPILQAMDIYNSNRTLLGYLLHRKYWYEKPCLWGLRNLYTTPNSFLTYALSGCWAYQRIAW